MGKASKSWMTLVRKVKSLMSLKSSKKSKENAAGSDITDITNRLLQDPESRNVSDIGSDEKALEFKVGEIQESVATEGWFPDTSATPGGVNNELQTVELAPTVHHQQQDECRLPPPSAPLKDKEQTPLKDKEQAELAAVKIQAAFRGAMARKRLKAMKAVERLRSVLHGKATKKQTSSAMRCMQSYAKVQSQVKIQRARLTEFLLQQRKEQEEGKKTEEELDDWNDSTLSKEQILARVRSKRQAAAKRERTLAYAFSHQLWRSYPRDLMPPPVDDEMPAWTWNWLEQWMSTRSWKSLEDGKPDTNNHGNAAVISASNASPIASPMRKFPKSPRSPLPNGKTTFSPRFYASPLRNKIPTVSYDGGSKSPASPGATRSSPLHPSLVNKSSPLHPVPLSKSSPLHPAMAGTTRSKSFIQRTGVLTPNNVRQSPTRK